MSAKPLRVTLAHRLLQQLRERRMVRAGERVGVAVSGGADSLALLLLLAELREKLGIVLTVVHFNHQLRGRASELDEKFVAKLAAKLSLAFHAGRADVAAKAKREKTNLEDAARRARYGYFSRLVEEKQVARIAVAHTADDQAETVLAHLLRGTGLAGLGGIHPAVGAIFRPLLTVRRSELRTYLRAKKQIWREDATNRDTTRTRARIRNKLIPFIEKYFQPGIVEHLAALAGLAREDEAYFEAGVEERFCGVAHREDDEIRVAIADLFSPAGKKEFNAEDTESTEDAERATKNFAARALSKRLIRRIVAEVKQRAGQLGAGHVEAILELAHSGKSGRLLPLPGGLEVRRERDALVFRVGSNKNRANHGNTAREFEHRIDLASDSQDVNVPELGCVFRLRVIDWPSKRGETYKTGAVLDRDRLQFPLVLRNWLPGDRMQPLGRRNTHKLKRLLNEKGISRWARDGWPVLMSGTALAWTRGFPVAAEFAANERTRVGMVIAEEGMTAKPEENLA